jgi:hypothetical protein
MKKLSVLLMALSLWAGVRAQDMGVAVGTGRVEVVITDGAAPALRNAGREAPLTSVTAYGVRLFSDNSQEGRANAYAARNRFAEMFPGINVDVTYESPAFWVTAGCFLDRLDAVALCGRALAQFKNAFVVGMEVPVTDIIAREKNIPQKVEDE